MGVTACGKSTVGKLLAQQLSIPFIEGDEFHPPENITKMSTGTPLTDEDRYPWLEALSRELKIHEQKGGAVLACSALKEVYREILQREVHEKITWIYLEGSESILRERIRKRNGHFMPEELLHSQLITLEIPSYAYCFSIEKEPETYLRNLEELSKDLRRTNDSAHATAWVGIAPHSVRAVPLDYLRQVIQFAEERKLPIHMHVAEQQAEVSACIQEYGRSPAALLATEGLLSERFTAVHAIHVTPKAIAMLATACAMICACPTTERNLGDGIVPADSFFKQGLRVALGTDSHVEIDLLEDARELEYHLRLQKMERAVLGSAEDSGMSAIAARLFASATVSGAESIDAPGGTLEPGRPADFFTVDLNDPSVAGASKDDLLSSIVFGSSKTAVKDVVVGGNRIVEDSRHAQQEEIVERFKKLQKKLWG